MCSGLRVHHIRVTPGKSLKYITLSGERLGIWGLGRGMGAYNARSENLETTWKGLKENRAVVEVDSFEEKGALYHSKLVKTQLAAIFDDIGDIVILTRPATGGVELVHPRMPVILPDGGKEWLGEGALPWEVPVEPAKLSPEAKRFDWLKFIK
jgi:putative SOS response-associated peptidase YedK